MVRNIDEPGFSSSPTSFLDKACLIKAVRLNSPYSAAVMMDNWIEAQIEHSHPPATTSLPGVTWPFALQTLIEQCVLGLGLRDQVAFRNCVRPAPRMCRLRTGVHWPFGFLAASVDQRVRSPQRRCRKCLRLSIDVPIISFGPRTIAAAPALAVGVGELSVEPPSCRTCRSSLRQRCHPPASRESFPRWKLTFRR